MATLTVASRFCGPPGTANGGYVAGLIAQHSRQQLRIRLQKPIPLDTPLEIGTVDDGLTLKAGEQLLASARTVRLELNIPAAPDYAAALEASRHFAGFGRHAYPGCFVCGTHRSRGDGLRIFAGEPHSAGRLAPGLVAAPWLPDATLADGDGRVRPEFMAAALDCPGYFAARADGLPMLLGEYAAHIHRCVHIDEPCVVIGWRIAAQGRKHEVGTALFGRDGGVCGFAQALWVEPRSAAPGP